jgi:hypothetical protein
MKRHARRLAPTVEIVGPNFWCRILDFGIVQRCREHLLVGFSRDEAIAITRAAATDRHDDTYLRLN